jgi:hypothetical protein
MTTTKPPVPARRTTPPVSEQTARVLLVLYALALMVLPSNMVLAPVGAAGYPASLVALLIFAIWCTAIAFGLHRPGERRHPIRVVLALLWAVSLASYARFHFERHGSVESLAADRWLLLLAAITGVAVVAAECLHRVRDVHRVLQALIWGGAFCGLTSAVQFFLNVDPTEYLRLLPGFTAADNYSGIISRGAISRVSGTALHPIELGSVSGILLPLAVHLAVHDVTRAWWRRWLPVALIGAAVPASVSRSAIVAIVIALGVYIVLLPAAHRLTALAAVPVGVLAVFMTARGFFSTLTGFILMGTSDPSISTRTDDYELVAELVGAAPWFGHGGGTYIPDNFLDITDNQYLKTAIELGATGVVTLLLLQVVPLVMALAVRRRSDDEVVRSLCSAFAGATAAIAVGSLTFDSFSFPMYVGVQALLLGLVGALWRVVPGRAARPHQRTAPRTVPAPTVLPHTADLPKGAH